MVDSKKERAEATDARVEFGSGLGNTNWPLHSPQAPAAQTKPSEVKGQEHLFLYRGLPGNDREHSRLLAGRLALLYVNGPPRKRVSPRFLPVLKHRLDLEPWWFDLLRTLILRCDAEEEMIVVVESTAPFLAASRAARLFGRTLLRFELPVNPFCRNALTLSWFSYCLDLMNAADNHPPDVSVDRVLVSPELHPDLTRVDPCASEFPLVPFG